MSEIVQVPEPAAPIRPEFHFDDSPLRLEAAVRRTESAILRKLQADPDLVHVIAGQMLITNNAIVPGLVPLIAPEDLKYSGHKQLVADHAARVVLFTLASDSLVTAFEPEIQSGLAYPPDHRASDVQKACEQMNYDGQAPEYSLQFGDRSLKMLSPLALNALNAHHLAHIFRTLDLSSSPETNDRLILLGWLYGYFDPNHPDYEHNRRFIIPAISPEAPACLQELKKQLLSAEDLDTPRLQKLKSFWGDAFGVYWASLKRTEESPVRELDDATVRLVQKKLHGDPHFFLPRRVAHVISQAEFNQHRRRLNVSIQDIATQYRGSPASFGELKALFNNEISHRVFACLGETSAEALPDTADMLIQIVGVDHCDRFFGPDFTALPDVEKVALIGFSAFVSNGSLIKGSERAVTGLQRVVIPQLRNHHDVLAAEKAGTEDAPVDAAWRNFSAAESIAVAQKARTKLERLTPDDGVVSTHHPEALQLVKDSEIALATAAEISESTLRSLDINRIRLGRPALDFVAGLIGVFSGVAAYEAYASQQYASFYMLISGVSFAIGTIFLAAASGSAKLNTAEAELYSAKLLGTEIAAKAEKLKEKLNLSQFNQLSNYLTLMGFVISAGILIPHADQAVNFVKDFLPKSSDGTSDTLPQDLQLIEISRATTFLSEDIGNPGEKPQPGKPVFATVGSHGPLFWVDKLCAAWSQNRFTCSTVDDEFTLLPSRTFSSPEALTSWVTETSENGRIARFNTNPYNIRFQIPIGYKPIETFGYKSGLVNAKFSPWGGLRISSQYLSDNTVRGVVYEPIPSVYSESSLESARLPHEQVLPPEFFAEPGLELAKPVYDWARDQFAQKSQTGITNEQILAGIKSRIQALGVSYGYQSFDTSDTVTAKDVFRSLFAPNSEGIGPSHNLWICNESSYAMYLIANSVGIEVYMPIGYSQSTDVYDGGYATDAHQILIFRNEAGLFQSFESTLPSAGGENQPAQAEAPFDQKAADRQSLIIALSAAGAVLGSSLTLANADKLGKLIKKSQKHHAQLLEHASTASLSASLQACYWLADGFGSPEYTNLLGSDEAYAAQVAHDALSLALSVDRPALSFINASTVDAAESEAQIIKDGRLPYWLENPEKTANVIDGGELVLVYLKRQIDQNQGTYTPEEKRKANSLFRILKTLITSAKHRQENSPL